jgi:hypothetical protein
MSESSLKLVEVYIRRNIDLAVKGMSGEMSQRGAADVFKWWMFMAADVIGELSFGESFKMLESGKVSTASCIVQLSRILLIEDYRRINTSWIWKGTVSLAAFEERSHS